MTGTSAGDGAGDANRSASAAGSAGRTALALTRRRFLAAGTAGAAGLYAASAQQALAETVLSPVFLYLVGVNPDFVVTLRRREDMLLLGLEGYNLLADKSDPADPKIVKKAAGQKSYLVFVFQPQNVAEQAFIEVAPEVNANQQAAEPLPVPGQAVARLAGKSRLAFEVPAGTVIPLTMAAVLDWASLQQAIVPVAKSTSPYLVRSEGGSTRILAGQTQQIRKPENFETALELPWNLVLSPSEKAAWAHSTTPVTRNGRTELWHTRLGVRTAGGGVDERDAAHRTVRAVWTYDPTFPEHLAKQMPSNNVPPATSPPPWRADDAPFRMSLSERDRHDIVRITSDYLVPGWTPKPVDVKNLMLSPLGAWIDSQGTWDAPSSRFSLAEWRQRGTMGRDHYVRIVRKGYLFPFGHKAVLLKITERKIQPVPGQGQKAAYLRQRYFLVVKQERRDFGAAPVGARYGGRSFPFTSVRITTRATPNLDPASGWNTSIAGKDMLFMPTVGGSPFLFHAIGTDWDGDTVEFTVPLVFMDSTLTADYAGPQSTIAKLVGDYPAHAESLRTAHLDGQRMSLAPSRKKGDTQVEVKSIVLGTMRAGDVPPVPGFTNPWDGYDAPPFLPQMQRADVRLGGAEEIAGAMPGPSIAYTDGYVNDGFTTLANGKQSAEVFAALVDRTTGQPASQKLDFSSDRSGGAATPNFAIEGLSRRMGTVADLKNVDLGTLDPASFLSEAKLLGGLDLADVIQSIPIVEEGGELAKQVLRLAQTKLPDRVETHMHWSLGEAQLQVDKDLKIFEPRSTTKLVIDALAVARLDDPKKSTYSVEGQLKHFKLHLLGTGGTEFLELDVNYLKFTAKKGKKQHVDVDIKNVEYKSVLKFVKALADLMSIGDGGSGPAIEIKPTGIKAGFSAPIPSLQVGVFSLSNMRFGASVNIPFSGKPARVRFDFSRKHDPFCLSVSMFGGGGFFSLAVGTDGVELVEAALEFGANISIDLGIASGGIHVMGGVYFKFEHDSASDTDTVVLTGYVRMGGEVSVMAIVSISIELTLSLTYKSVTVNGKEKDKVMGKADLALEVRVLIFSATFHVTVKKQFGNAPGDPTFADFMPADLQQALPGESLSSFWNDYCDAFAEEAA